MKSLCWNVRRLGSPRAVQRLCFLVKQHNPHLVFLMETKLDKKMMEKVWRRCGFEHGIEVEAEGSRGGLCMAWEKEIVVNLRSFSRWHIDVLIKEDNVEEEWRYWDNKDMEAFRETLMECRLFDIGFSGVCFTWERGNLPETNIRERKFHFEAWWTMEESLEKVIRESWEATEGTLLEKLGKLQLCLQDWSRTISRNKEGLKRKLMKELEALAEGERDDDILAKLIDTKIHLNLEIDKDEMYWEQRARQNWLKLGDKNTSYFHRCALTRRQTNTISKLVTEEGIEIEEESEILSATSSFFQNLFKSKGVVDPGKIALKGMGPTKAPGSDGFPALFYQRYWHIVGRDVTEFCLGILNENQDFGDFNSTDIVLIPKVLKPMHLVNFRPISLCSIIYKVVAKTIANRLQKIIDKCIDKVQSALVLGRLITDNVLLAYEIFHTINQKRSGNKGVMAVKLDRSKAYDRVEWGFIEELRGQDKWKEGEGLSSLTRTAKRQGLIKGAKASRQGPTILHLLFADDCILFGEASHKGAKLLKDILQDYEICSGQCVNFSKSTVFFSPNTIEEDKAVVPRLLRIRVATNPEKYLGLPNMIGRRKKESFQNLLDRISMCIEGWSNRMLSQGGKEVFIKSILQAIPTFAMSCFLLPNSLCKKMEGIFANFWWQKGKGKKGIHWCQWSHLCRPKNEGGLGFRNMAQFNTTLLAKQGWRFLENPNSLVSQVFKAKYFLKSDFLNSQLGNRNSYAWRSIWATRGILEKGMIWKVGMGESISIVYDAWVLDLVNSRLLSSYTGSTDNKVVEVINCQAREWKREVVEYTFGADEADKILRIPLAKHPHDDLRCGLGSESLLHLFRDCPTSVIMWSDLTEIQLLQDLNADFKQWLTSSIALLSLDSCRFFCVALWAIWGDRNARIHEKRSRTGKEIADFVRNYVKEINGAKPKVVKSSKNVKRWQHPPYQTMKINFDGAFDTKEHLSTPGVVVRDNEGSVLASKSRLHEKVASAFAAEALACREAVRLGIDMQNEDVIIEGDSLTVIKKCRNVSPDRSLIGSYIFYIHQMQSFFKAIRFEFISRSENTLAHTIATESLKNKEEFYLDWGVPIYAEARARNDSLREPD
ncbi:reverse transcriptase [Gossypium australe]|uniref:Reverse transcriptase n=1 Tax=Gossypium australe TaxID=47621 RepID=A0A5B6UEY6_9ROSI|nr:reverse transcriptase [Gossypium australe]